MKRGERLERFFVRPPRLLPFLVLLVQAPELEPHLHEALIELERRAKGMPRPLPVADLERDVALQLVQIRAVRRSRLRLAQRRERPGGIARRGPRPRHGDQHLDILGRPGDQLFRQRQGFGRSLHGEQAFYFAERGGGVGAIERARLAIALQRFAVQAAARIDVAEQCGSLSAVRAALHGPHRFGDREVHHPLVRVVARQRQRIVLRLFGEPGRRGLLRRCGRRQLLKDVVQQALIERKLAAQILRLHVGRDFRHDADRDGLVLEIDRERELLRHVVGIELERPLRRPQRAVEVPEIRQRKAQVVMRAGVLRIGFDRPHEGVAGVGKALQLDQHQPDAVPRRCGARLSCEHLAVGLERQLKPPEVRQQEREIESSAHEFRRQLQRFPKGFDRFLGIALMGEHDADVVPGERIARIDFGRLPIGSERLARPSRLMQHHAALVPELGRIGDIVDQRLVQLERVAEVALQEVNLGHRLADKAAVLATLDREAVFAQRLGVVALLPEREAEIEMREFGALGDLGKRHVPQSLLGRLPFGAIALQRQVRLGARQRRVELDRALGSGARILITPHVTEHERHQVVRVGVIGVERDRALKRR